MIHYYLDDDQQASGSYEVHENGCPYCSDSLNRTYLGLFSTAEEVIIKAKDLFPLRKIRGCIYCLHSNIKSEHTA
jgi:hypothetical protein